MPLDHNKRQKGSSLEAAVESHHRPSTGNGSGVPRCFAALAALLTAFSVGNADAYSSGITGRTNKDGGAGCGSCHSPNATLGVSISGPANLAAGAQGSYTISITNGAASSKAGVNIAASSDNLSESSIYLQKPDDDLTHNSTDDRITDASGATTFSFKFTMPGSVAVGGTRTLYAAARVGVEWNHAANFVITVPKLDQTITFGAQTSPRTYSPGATFSVSPLASATSGLAITYTSDTTPVCTVSGTTVTMQGAGTCTLRANQNGNSTYNAAPDVTRSITINKGNQTITFGSQVVMPYFSNGGTFSLSPAASASSGLAIVYSSNSTGVCTKPSSGTLVNMVSVGNCSITAAQPGNSDWNPAVSVNRSITINKGNQSITFPAQSDKAFVLNGTFSVTGVAASSGLAVTYTSLTPTVCTTPGTTSNTVTMLDNGLCTIEASQNGNANFNPAADVNGDISLTETPLQPLITSAIVAGDTRATIPIGANGNGPGVTYTATCTAAGQTTRTGSSTTVYSPIVVLNLVNSVAYSCTVTASNSFGVSPPSSPASVTPISTPIGPTFRSAATLPPASYAFNVGASKTFVVVTTARPNAVLTNASSLPSGMTFQTNATNARIPPGLAWLGGVPAAGSVGSYSLTLKADNSQCGTLPPCPTQTLSFSVAKGSPTITFPAVADQQYTASPTYNLAATIATPNSTLAASNIVFTSATSPVCTVSGTLLTTVGVGTCTINANSANASLSYTASYNPASQVARSFSINKGNQSITFGAQASRTYSPGGSFAISPTASASSGLAVGYASLTPSTCSVAGTTVTIIGAGTCTIEASQDGNALYLAAADVTQNVVIGKAAQSIAFPAQAAQPFVQGGSFAISPLASATSGLPIDYTSATPGVCMAAGTNITILSAGICTVTAAQPGDQNYFAASSVNANISINAVPPGAPTLNDTLANDSTIRLYFDPPASDGGAAVTGYRGTCNPGGVTANGASQPVVVGGLTNNTAYTCTVAAQNSKGVGAESNALMATPTLRSGTVLWNAVCSGCHGATPNAGRLNAAGATGNIIAYVRSVQPEMLADGAVQALTANELSEIAKYIRDQLSPITANTAYVTPVDIDVGLPKHLYLGGVAFDAAQVVSQPANGTLSAFNGTVITYTPNPGFAGMDSFTYRGRRSSPLLLGDAFTVTVNVATPPAPAITSPGAANGVFGQPFSYQISATQSPVSYGASPLGAGVTIDTASGLISGTPGQAGVFNVTVSATNPGGTGMQLVQVTISPAAQSITFGAQSGPQPFGAGFPVSPLASSTSGLTVTYSSLTPSVCTVAGTNVTPVAAGVCTVAADQGGNANYNAALQVTQNVTISAVAPGAPTGVMGVAGVMQASLSFSPPSNTGGSPITQYSATCSPSGSGTSATSPITVGGLTNGVQYSCTVTATNAAALTGPDSSPPVLATPTAALVAPNFTSANATSFSVLANGTFTVTATGNLPPVLSVSGTLPSGVTFVPATGVLSGLPASGTANASPYPLTFTATNATGTVMQSFTLTVAKVAQTISFANPGTQSYAQAPIPLAASSSSGLAVTLSSNTPAVCTVSGANLTTVAPGVCSITAAQAGNADYLAANDVTRAFTIAKAGQTITFSAQASPRNFSTTPFALSPVAFATSALPISYSTTTPAVCTMAGNNVNTLSAGVCTIAANQAGDANYNAATQVTQSVTIDAIAPGAPVIGVASGSDMAATLNFTPPSSAGGSAIATYTATCNPGGVTGNNSASPVTVGGLSNGTPYTCSVTATNQAGKTSGPSGSVMVTPTSANGSALWTSVCANCHAASPSGNQLNGAGSTATVLQHVRTAQPLMAISPPVQNLTQSELAAIAVFIRDQLPANAPSTSQNSPVQVDVASHIHLTGQAWSAFTDVEVVTPPTNGMLGTFAGTVATYTPNPGFAGIDSFTYRGKRTSPNVDGDPVQVTITVLPGAPSITSAATANGTFNAPFSYQILATGTPTSFGAAGLPTGLVLDTMTGAISGTAGAGGVFNATISATNAGGTGMAPLTLTIAPAAQTITFASQSPSSQSFVPGGPFPINPLASGGGSGNPVTYSSITSPVCTVSGTTVTMVFGGTCTIAANQAGNANYAAASQATQNVTITPVPPGMPVIGTATPGNAQAQVSFGVPASNGGSAIIDYTVTCTASGQTTRTGTAANGPITVTGLANNVTYSCSVTARNAAAANMGIGPASSALDVTPAAVTVPGAPTIGIPDELDGAASIVFSPPASNGGSAILGYTVTCNPGMKTASAAGSPILVSGLSNGVTYTCSVTAMNSAGTGAASATVDVTPFAPIALDRVESRKQHGGFAGILPLAVGVDVNGAYTVEPRVIGAGHQIVFVFTGSLGGNPGTVSVLDAAGMTYAGINASVVANGSEAVVTLANVPEATRLTVQLTNAGGSVNAAVAVGFLPGDVNGTGKVTAADIAAVKARSGNTPVDASNFKLDINASGTISAADVSTSKARAGRTIP